MILSWASDTGSDGRHLAARLPQRLSVSWKCARNNVLSVCATQEHTAAADAVANAADAADAGANADADATPAAGTTRATVTVACV